MNKFIAAQIAYAHCPVNADLREELNRMDEENAKEEDLQDRIDAKVKEINSDVMLWNESVIEFANSQSDREKRYCESAYDAAKGAWQHFGTFSKNAVNWYARKLVNEH